MVNKVIDSVEKSKPFPNFLSKGGEVLFTGILIQANFICCTESDMAGQSLNVAECQKNCSENNNAILIMSCINSGQPLRIFSL